MAHLTDRNLILEHGERIVFPVEPRHHLAESQRLSKVNSLEDVKDFAFVKEWESAFPTPPKEPGGAPSTARVNLPGLLSKAQLLDEIQGLGDILELQLADFIVPAGATVVMQNPLNRINADKVIIEGALEVHGELTINCNEIRGS
jgi:hypothetical protein